jgi:allene oxide cyclase
VSFSKPRAKGRLRVAALAATATAVAAVAVAGVGTSSARTPRASSGQIVHVIEHAITDTEIPTGGGKDVKGNTLTFNNPVFDPSNKTQVGHDEGFCTRIAPDQKIWECLWTTFVDGGQITVQGPYYDNRNSVLSITGGTGAYRDARGQMELLSREGGTEYDFIFEIS